MKSFTSQFTSNLLGRSSLGVDEVFALVNLYEEPCALIDLTTDRLLFLNSQLVKQTAFSNSDLREKSTGFLFPNLDLKSLTSGEFQEIELNRRALAAVNVRVRFDFIDPNARWVVIRLLPRNYQENDEESRLEKLFAQIIDFVKISERANIENDIPQMMDLVCRILNVDTACLFQAEPTFPTLKRIYLSGGPSDFPAELPSTDLVRLVEPVLWKHGNRVITEIHRHARINAVEYVATAPLKQDDAAIGILAVCGKGQIPKEMRISVLEFIAFQLMDLIQKSTLTRNLEEKILSEQKKIELRNVTVENMQEGALLLLPDLTIAEINPSAEWMLGYADWEVKGQPFDNILIGADRLMPALEDAKKGNTTHNIGKTYLNRRNGQSFPVQIKVIPVMRSEQLLGIEILLIDISENEQSKALTQQLEHRAVLGDYTAAFAHDVRNPINNISTGIQLLGAKLPPDDPNQEIITRVQNDCTRLNHLMESFLAFSRPLELKFEPIDLNNYLQRIIDRWRPKFAKVNVTPVIHIDAGITRIKGDPRSLDQVFTNLISNALDAMTDTGDMLAIRAVMNNDIASHPNIDISISDNGPGIPEDIKEHIFEPFVTTRQKGTGLGLAITKQIVTAHKGSISVNSFPGGTVFTIRLPADNGE
ncbi:MAG: two-component sensor histidine kinase [Chloroflexi bacterium]|nr:MAG: two-component sensor histidine kinase [Chloroflexota bacterium]